MNKLTYHGRPLTAKQQQAVIVCGVCALVLLVTILVTTVLVTKQVKASQLPGTPSDSTTDGAFGIDSPAVLAPTEDAGEAYLNDTLFIGDSNTVRLYNNGLVTLQQYVAREGLTIQDASTLEMVSFKRDERQYTIPQAVAKMKPRRVLITLGTNNADGSLSQQEFIAAYRSLIQSIQSAYPYTDIIVNTIPPIPNDHSKYPALDQSVIDGYNLALAALCEEMNCKLLNSAEALKDVDGSGQEGFYNKEDIHLTLTGLQTILNYYTTHAWETEDRRPDTDHVPTRAEDFIAATAAPATPEPSEEPEEEGFTAAYNTQTIGSKKNNGGTLTHGKTSGKTSLSVKVKEEDTSVTVKAVPNPGYVFVKWSDGSTNMERTDKKFKQNLDVTAMFAPLQLTLNREGKAEVHPKDEVRITAGLSSDKYAKLAEVVWFVNGSQVSDVTGGVYSFVAEKAGKVEIYAQVSYNGQTVRSKTLTVEITEVVVVDKSKLDEAIQIADGKKKESFTAESWDAFAKALANAKAVSGKKDATQAEVDNAKNALNEAIVKLAPVPQATEAPTPQPTEAPTQQPTEAPTQQPTEAPAPEAPAETPDPNVPAA